MESMLALVALVAAQDPTSSVDASGTVEVRCTVAASEAEVRALLGDAVRTAQLAPDTLTARPTTRGPCTELGMTVKGPLDPIVLRTLRCPTTKGWSYSLLDSDTVTTFSAEWKLTPSASGGTDVVYRIQSDVNLPVPKFLVRKGVLASAQETLRNLIKQVTRR